MGSQVSVRKDQETSVIMNYQLPENSSETNDKNLSIPPSAALDFKSQNYGSKEENFFDSQAWLESDCDDDFCSVNGEFTPSRNSASGPQSISIGTKEFSAESSPTDKKKRLSELQEGLWGDVDVSRSDKQNTSNGKVEIGQANIEHIASPRTPRRSAYMFGLNSLCGSEKNPSRYPKPEKEKSAANSVQCCLPSYLMPSRSYTERKKRLSPERNGLAA